MPGKIKNPTRATGIVKIPSMINSHLQPGIPPTPERFVYAADCRYPLTIDPSGLQMNQAPARLKSSGPEYQDPSELAISTVRLDVRIKLTQNKMCPSKDRSL